MAGERQLALRGEDAGAVGRLAGRWQHENGLRQVELAGQRMHLVTGEIFRAVDHGERVAREGAVGEHVDDLVRHGGHVRTLT
jgi:hypothetical protein